MYLDLLRAALTHTLYWPPDLADVTSYVNEEFLDGVRAAIQRRDFDPGRMRAEGQDWPRYAQTMVGSRRLENVQQCVERVIADDIPGDLIEAGVWRGGVGILMRGVLKAYGIESRQVVLADSFQGLPVPNPELYPHDAGDRHHAAALLAVSRAEVERNFRMYDLLDDHVEFVEGWFSDTLPGLRERSWAIVRLDGDLYESTMDGLENVYDGLSVGGFVIIDDYAFEPCKQAVADFRATRRITEPIDAIDWTGAMWRRMS